MSECNITLLPEDQCAHCTGAQDLVIEPVWEERDYVTTRGRTVINGVSVEDYREETDSITGEQFTSEVSMFDIYGANKSARITRSK